MIIKNVTQTFRIARREDLPVLSQPGFAFAGRSNSGKSSLINALLRRKKLAAVSGTPGRTRALHYYNVNDAFYIIDLPGYGYASMSRAAARRLEELFRSFLEKSPPTHLFLLQDSRRSVADEEAALIEASLSGAVPVTLVLTKCDKLKSQSLKSHAAAIRKALPPEVELLTVSSRTGEGIEKIRTFISHNSGFRRSGRRPVRVRTQRGSE